MSRSATATLTALGVGAAGELTTTPARTLPVRGELAGLLPWGGLRRGSTVSVRGSTSLLLALVAAATAEGCWAAVVGLPGCGVLAAAELGVAVHRLALVPRPGRDQSEVERTVAALLDGFDLVALATPVTPATARKLSGRSRHRKAVLLPFTIPWPGADVELTATASTWTGLEPGHGLLSTRTLAVRATGRGAAARPKQTSLALPAPTTAPPTRPALVPLRAAGPSRGAADPPDLADPPHPTGSPRLAAGSPQPAGLPHSADPPHPADSRRPVDPPHPADSRRPVGSPHPADSRRPVGSPRLVDPPRPVGSRRPVDPPRLVDPPHPTSSPHPGGSPRLAAGSPEPSGLPRSAGGPPRPAGLRHAAGSSRPVGDPPQPVGPVRAAGDPVGSVVGLPPPSAVEAV